jgi:polar amino acid transport system substrate-binding protein
VKRIAALCLACATLLLGAASLWAQPALRVGIAPGSPPLHFYSEGELVGVEADNARTVAEILSRRVQLVPLSAERLRPALLGGDIDVIMSGLVREDPENDGLLLTEPYLRAGQMPILHETGVTRFGQPWAIYADDVRIGVTRDSAGEAFIRSERPEADPQRFATAERAFEALRAGEIDLFLHDAATSWNLATSDDNRDLISLYRPLTEEHLVWAVAPGNPGLLRDLNQALNLMRANGTLEYIIDRWIPVQVDDIP